jgi:hypothetical protein
MKEKLSDLSMYDPPEAETFGKRLIIDSIVLLCPTPRIPFREIDLKIPL